MNACWEANITREEIFFTGKENVEGFVSLLSYFLPQMMDSVVKNPALINIDNQDWKDEDPEEAKAGLLFYRSVMNFKDTFTENLPSTTRNKVHSITVKTNFNFMSTKGSDTQAQ